MAPAGKLQLYHSTLIEDSGEPEEESPNARQLPVEDLPPEALRYLLASRYCDVDRLLDTAGNLWGTAVTGGGGVCEGGCGVAYRLTNNGGSWTQPRGLATNSGS